MSAAKARASAKKRPTRVPEKVSSVSRSGYAALIGRPNVGKSTILNQLLGQKIAATTHKPQTTRKNILGVLHVEDRRIGKAEILLLDTPGYHRAEGPLNRFMVAQARSALSNADLVACVIEAREDAKVTPGNLELLQEIQRSTTPVVLIINKIDRMKNRAKLLPLVEKYRDLLQAQLRTVVPVSAIKKKGLGDLQVELAAQLPEGPPHYGEEEITDQPERAIVSEFIREKVILETEEELPYAAAVTVDGFEDERPRLVRIQATIHVERVSQKPIIIGRGGERIKAIGTRARKDIEHLLGSKVFLELYVRVTAGWSSHGPSMKMLGYRDGA